MQEAQVLEEGKQEHHFKRSESGNCLELIACVPINLTQNRVEFIQKFEAEIQLRSAQGNLNQNAFMNMNRMNDFWNKYKEGRLGNQFYLKNNDGQHILIFCLTDSSGELGQHRQKTWVRIE